MVPAGEFAIALENCSSMALARVKYFTRLSAVSRSPCPDAVKLSSGDGQEILLDGEESVRHGRAQKMPGSLSNVTTVLPVSGIVGRVTGPYRGERNYPLAVQRHQDDQNWQDRGIIPG